MIRNALIPFNQNFWNFRNVGLYNVKNFLRRFLKTPKVVEFWKCELESEIFRISRKIRGKKVSKFWIYLERLYLFLEVWGNVALFTQEISGSQTVGFSRTESPTSRPLSENEHLARTIWASKKREMIFLTFLVINESLEWPQVLWFRLSCLVVHFTGFIVKVAVRRQVV